MIRVFLTIIIFAHTSFSQERKGPPDSFGGGVAAIYSQKAYQGVEDNFLVVPNLKLIYKGVSVLGPNIGYRVFESESVEAKLFLNLDFFSGYESDDSAVFSGMEERKGTANLGGEMSYQFVRGFKIQVSHTKDILLEHEGTRSSVSLSFDFPISVLFHQGLPFVMIGASYGLEYWDRKYINYYYGVQAREATTERLSYQSGGGFNQVSRSYIRYKFHKNWAASINYSVSFLGDEVKDSPLVDEKLEQSLFASFVYEIGL